MPTSEDLTGNSLSKAQSKRLQLLADLSDEDIATLVYILRKEKSWTFVRSQLRTMTLGLAALITALFLIWDTIKSFLAHLFRPLG